MSGIFSLYGFPGDSHMQLRLETMVCVIFLFCFLFYFRNSFENISNLNNFQNNITDIYALLLLILFLNYLRVNYRCHTTLTQNSSVCISLASTFSFIIMVQRHLGNLTSIQYYCLIYHLFSKFANFLYSVHYI